MGFIEKVLIGVMIFSLVAVGSGIFFTSMYENYGYYDELSQQEKDAIDSLSQVNRINETIVVPFEQQIKGAEVNPLGALSFFIDSVIQGVKLFLDLPFIMADVIGGISIFLGILAPSWLIGGVIALIGLLVIIGIAKIILKVGDL